MQRSAQFVVWRWADTGNGSDREYLATIESMARHEVQHALGVGPISKDFTDAVRFSRNNAFDAALDLKRRTSEAWSVSEIVSTQDGVTLDD